MTCKPVSHSRSYVIHSDDFSVNQHFLYKNEHAGYLYLNVLVRIILRRNMQTSPMPRLGQISAYAGMISRSDDRFNPTYSLFIDPNSMPRRPPCADVVHPAQSNKRSHRYAGKTTMHGHVVFYVSVGQIVSSQFEILKICNL